MCNNKENHKLLTKRIDNYSLYVFADLFDDLKSAYGTENGLSEKSQNLIHQLSESLHNDVGHLKCDEVTDWYIIEEGFNWKTD